ncbi:hypothetical protein VTH82DRAFT_251 [Thermothelomyces myriococcoides]
MAGEEIEQKREHEQAQTPSGQTLAASTPEEGKCLPSTSNRVGHGQNQEQVTSSGLESQPSDPRIVEFAPDDPTNPLNYSRGRKWFLTSIVTGSILSITLTSSAYSSTSSQVMDEFGASAEVAILGVSLFVLGFAVGPALWAPLSELYGRRILFIITHGVVVAFVAASAGCKSMASLLVFRFLAGTFGASTMTNSGGVVADLFPPAERGLAMTIFSGAPFLGPVLGPVIGGFITITVGWRWVHAVCSIFVAVVWISGSFLLPETYGPVILQKKARALTRETGHKHITILEAQTKSVSPAEIFSRTLKRPWILLFFEPIVLISSIYLAILYGIIYMFLGAFPFVYQNVRGWNAGIGGLAFLGLSVGMLIGLIYCLMDNRRYKKLGKHATPESRLPPAILGALTLPASMFAFAWTNGPNIHWSASIILSAPFGFGCVPVFLGVLNYIVDAYTIYAASAIAAGVMLRSLFATAFPLFVQRMYLDLGIHWASSIPAFLTVACMPFPFVAYKYGATIRMKCKYAHEAAVALAKIRAADPSSSADETDPEGTRTEV